MRFKNKTLRSWVVFYIPAGVIAILMIAPLAWSSVISFFGKRATDGEGGFGLGNYERLAGYGEGIWVYAFNSIVISFVAVVGTIAVTVLGGYAFARFKFPGKNLLFGAALAILMIPNVTVLIPIYTILRKLEMQNSLIGVGIVLIMFQLPFGLFVMRNAFSSLPREIEEAALVDGCTPFGALFKILVRSVTPAIATVGVFSFLIAWNEFLAPLILLSDGNKFPLPIALLSLRSGEYMSVDLGALQAGILVTALPCLLVFLFLQKYYVRGITSGSVR